MPDLATYSVKFPDGHVQTFDGPTGMSEVSAQNRAIQERAFAEDKIPSSYWGGVKQSVGDTIAADSGKIGTAISLAGGLAGQPEVVAAGPLAGRAIKAGGEALGNRDITPTSASELAVLGAEGLGAGYGPAAVGKVLRAGAASTVAHQLPSGQWVKGISGHGILPWAVRTAGEVAAPVADAIETATPEAVNAAVRTDVKTVADTAARLKAGVSKEDLQLLLDNIANGMKPSTAAKVVAGNDQGMIGKLLTLYMRSRMKP